MRVQQTPSQHAAPLGEQTGATGSCLTSRLSDGCRARGSPRGLQHPVQTAVKRKYKLQLHLVFHKTPHTLLPGRSYSEFMRQIHFPFLPLVLEAKLSPWPGNMDLCT